MSYKNEQIAKKIADIILQLQTIDSSFINGRISYGAQKFTIPQTNAPKRNTTLINK